MINGGISREWPHLTIRAVKGVERILSLKFDPVEKMGERSILIVSVAIEGLGRSCRFPFRDFSPAVIVDDSCERNRGSI